MGRGDYFLRNCRHFLSSDFHIKRPSRPVGGVTFGASLIGSRQNGAFDPEDESNYRKLTRLPSRGRHFLVTNWSSNNGSHPEPFVDIVRSGTFPFSHTSTATGDSEEAAGRRLYARTRK